MSDNGDTAMFEDLSHAEQNAAVISAMRLASYGAANDKAALEVLRMLLEKAPATPGWDTVGPRLLTDLLRADVLAVTT